MKKIIALTLSFLIVSSVSQAWIVRGDRSTSGSQSSQQISVQDCSDSLYASLSIFSSLTDRACSFGRTDREFQGCVINIADSIGHHNVEIAAQACATTRNLNEANCAVDLYYQGGLYVSNPAISADGVRICARTERNQLKNCIIDRYQNRRLKGEEAAKVCLEQYDPVMKARREAELRRAEEARRIEAAREVERRRIEAAKEAERRRVEAAKEVERRRIEAAKEVERRRIEAAKEAELRRVEAAKEAERRRQQEEQQRKSEAPKKVETPKSPTPAPVAAPTATPKSAEPASNQDDGGGVVVDLPNFE